LWSHTSASGEPLPASTPERRGLLIESGAQEQYASEVESLLGRRDNLSAAARQVG
jgi:hypothetical protein